MTIYDLVTEISKNGIYFPVDIPKINDIENLETELIQRTRNIFLNDEIKPTIFKMKFKYVRIKRTESRALTFGIVLEPADEETKFKLIKWRQDISTATKIQNIDPNYGFHITLAYEYLNVDINIPECAEEVKKVEHTIINSFSEFGVLEIGPPKFVLFKDMTEFNAHNFSI